MLKKNSSSFLRLKIDVKADGRFKFDRNLMRRAVRGVLLDQQMKGRVHLSVAVVGDRKMKLLNKKYLDKDETTDVLSFSQTESVENGGIEIVDTDELLLGDVVVSYPQAKRQAIRANKLLDEEIAFLVCHGVLHLLGVHHD